MGEAAQSQEYVLRAPGPEHSLTKYFLGMFPGGEPRLAAQRAANWQLKREPLPEEAARADAVPNSSRPWLLEDAPGSVSHRGALEGGLSGAAASAGYFVLLREGDAFTAFPADQFYNFRPTQRFKVNDLDEAERQMNSNSRVVFASTSSRLASLAAKVEEDGGVDEDDVASGSDREDYDEADRPPAARKGPPGAAAAAAAKGPAAPAKPTHDAAAEHAEEGEEGKGEDWEHEDERADDDLDMGEDAEDAEASPSPPGPRAGSDSDEDGRRRTPGGGTPGDHQDLQRVLANAGLDAGLNDEDDAEDGVEDDKDDDEDDGDDDEDLDALAAGFQAKAAGKAATPGPDNAKRKRTPTPQPPVTSAGKQKGGDEVPAAAKKAKTSPATPSAGSAEAGLSGAATSTAPVAGGVTEQEIVAFLRASGPIPSSTLTARFKPQLKTTQHKSMFTQLVKRVAKLEEVPPGSGTRCIVLRQG